MLLGKFWSNSLFCKFAKKQQQKERDQYSQYWPNKLIQKTYFILHFVQMRAPKLNYFHNQFTFEKV